MTPREGLDEVARALVWDRDNMDPGEMEEEIAAALRATETEALERAAQYRCPATAEDEGLTYRCSFARNHPGSHNDNGMMEWSDESSPESPPAKAQIHTVLDDGTCPACSPIAPAPAAAEKRIVELEAALRKVAANWLPPESVEIVRTALAASPGAPGKGEG